MSAAVLSGLYLVVAGVAYFANRSRHDALGLTFWGPLILANLWMVAWRLR